MKHSRFFTMCVLFFVSTLTLSAQFNLGLKVAYVTNLGFNENWTLTNGKMNFGSDPAHGFDFGVMARIGRRFYVQPEFLYNLQSYHYTFGMDKSNLYSQREFVSAIDIPVLLGYKLLNTKIVQFSMLVGPHFKVNIGDEKKITDGASFVSSIRGSQVGLDVGLALDVMKFTIDFRYNLMQGINRYSTLEGKDLNSPISNNFSLSIGWFFLNI